MTHRRLVPFALASLAFLFAAPAGAQKLPTTWDGLVQVPSKRLDFVYLLPGADFRPYTKVLMDPTEVAFHKNWQREHNSGTRSLGSRISDSEIEHAISKAVVEAGDIFAAAWTKAGYALATAPGPDVLRVRTGVLNIRVNAPDRPSAGRSRSFASEAGSATLFVEARDSVTNELLGRAVDQGVAGDNFVSWRTSASNRGDFRDLVQTWATVSVRGMDELKSRSPISR